MGGYFELSYATEDGTIVCFTLVCRVSEENIPWAVLVLNGTVFKKDLRDPKLFNALIPITQVLINTLNLRYSLLIP